MQLKLSRIAELLRRHQKIYKDRHLFNSLFFQDNLGKPAPERTVEPIWILMKQEMIGGSGSGVSWTICKSFAPCSRQITMPAPHHSIFYRLDALLDAQPTVSKH